LMLGEGRQERSVRLDNLRYDVSESANTSRDGAAPGESAGGNR